MTRLNLSQLDAAIKAGRITVTDSKGDKIARLVESRRRELAVPVEPSSPVVPRKVVEEIKLTIALNTASLNAANANRKAWIQAIAEVKKNVERVWNDVGRPVIVTPYQHEVEFHGGGLKDPSNLAAVFFKGALDAAQNIGMLPQDSAPWDRGGAYKAVVLNKSLEAAVWRVWSVPPF